MVECVTVPLDQEVTVAGGLSLKLRYLNQVYSSKPDRTSITLTLGSEWQELTLDLQTQRRWKEFAIGLEEIVTPARAKKGQAARSGAARFRIEKQPPTQKLVELGQPFELSLHDVARTPDGSTLSATEIGPYVTALSITRQGESNGFELGELGFGRWRDWVLWRDFVGAKSPCVAQLTIKAAAEPAPRLRYGEPFELLPGESVIGPDGLQVALGCVRNLKYDPCVEVQLQHGATVRAPQIYCSRAQEVRLGEVYNVHVKAVQAPPGSPVRVMLCVDKQSSVPFEFGREFRLKNGESARGPESILIAYPAAGHIHFTDRTTEGFLDFQILSAGQLHHLRVTLPAGALSSQQTWDGYTLAVRFDVAASCWAFVVDKKNDRRP